MAGTVKAFGLPVDYVLHGVSYANIVLMSATLPAYGAGAAGEGSGGGAPIDGSDSRNNAAVAAAFRE